MKPYAFFLVAALAGWAVSVHASHATDAFRIPSASLLRERMREATEIRVSASWGASWRRDTVIARGQWTEQMVRALLATGEVAWSLDDSWEGTQSDGRAGWERAPDVEMTWRDSYGSGRVRIDLRWDREQFETSGFVAVRKPIGERWGDLLVLAARAFPRDSTRFHGWPAPRPGVQRALHWRVTGTLPEGVPGFTLGPTDREPDDLPVLSESDLPFGCSVYTGGDPERLGIVEALVDPWGGVAAMRVVKSSASFDARAMGVVGRWRFIPAVQEGWPASVWVRVGLEFDAPE